MFLEIPFDAKYHARSDRYPLCQDSSGFSYSDPLTSDLDAATADIEEQSFNETFNSADVNNWFAEQRSDTIVSRTP